MGQYCDSQKLEHYWYHWILSSSVPALEEFRERGVLWTRVVGHAEHEGELLLSNGKPLPDPSYPLRLHCLALDYPLFFRSNEGVPIEPLIHFAQPLTSAPGQTEFGMAKAKERPASNDEVFLAELKRLGYVKEHATNHSWHNMLEDIRNICNGISMKFRLNSEDEQADLASDALLQVINKLDSGRLVYMPGRAPVFNLLTTTTYRIMYSILNKKNGQKCSIRKLIDDAAAGVLPKVGRSVRVPTIKSY